MNRKSGLKQVIVELLAEEGQLSTKEILRELENRRCKNYSKYKERRPQTIRDALREMADRQWPLIELVREKQSRRGKNEKFYSLTFFGAKWHFSQNKPSKKDFWKMMIIHSDATLGVYFKTQIKSKRAKNISIIDDQKIIERGKRDYQINIIDLIEFYEENNLHVHRDYFYSLNTKRILNHFRYATEEDNRNFKEFFPILEILAENKKQNYFGIMARLSEEKNFDEEKCKKILQLMFKKGLFFRWKGSVIGEFSLSIMGLLLVLDLLNQKYITREKKSAIWQKRRVNESNNIKEKEAILEGYKKTYPELYELMVEKQTDNEKILKKKIKRIVENYKEIFPIIFSDKNWSKLTREIDEIELILSLVDPYFEDTELSEGAHEQKNEILLLNSIEGIRRLYSLELHRFYRIGLDLCSAFARGQNCKIPITDTRGLISEEAVFFTYTPQEEYEEFAKTRNYDQNDLQVFFFFLWQSILMLHQLQIKLNKSDSMNFELEFNSMSDYNVKSSSKSVINVVSFEFFTRLKMEFPRKWNKIMENENLRNWYVEWLTKIHDFEKIGRSYQLIN